MEFLDKKIKDDFEAAFKSRDEIKTGTLRMLRAAIHNREIEKRGRGQDPTLTDEEVLEVAMKEVKKRREAIGMYINAGRNELAEKELKELAVLEQYLPEQMNEEELKKIIDEALKSFPGATEKDFGKIMGQVMKQVKGKADSSVIGRIIKEKIQ
ncbi:MAG: GatB/YqeY domain-containing protein [Patescibacteria group bacterium]